MTIDEEQPTARESGSSGPEVPTYLRTRVHVHSESRWSQFGHVTRELREVIRDLITEADLRSGATAVDYGCADSPYKNELPTGVHYVAADLPGNPVADIELVGGMLPLAADSCDLVLSTQVLEHVEDPTSYLAECHRVLKDGGSLVLSTHGVMYYHRDPEDYWRWTQPGLERTLAASGFVVVQTRGVLALAPAALQILQDATLWKVPRMLRRPYTAVMQALIAFADRRYEESTRIVNCMTIAVRAVKAERPRVHGH